MKENNFQNSIPFSEYPRPQMKRDSFFNLNGTWKLNGKDILVPFPPESKASNFNGKISSDLEYTKEFILPDDFITQLFQNNSKNHLLLHFVSNTLQFFGHDHATCHQTHPLACQ